MNNKLKQKIIKYFHKLRILKYKFLSTNENINGTPILNQPLLTNGLGNITFKSNVTIGFNPSPLLYTTYAYFEARTPNSNITIGENCFINNNSILISEGEGIYISKNCLIGINCEITDSDFHNLDADKRLGTNGIKTAKVILKENVFIGSNVKILKGVTIGKNSVIANGSVVTKDIPPNVIAGGIPAKKIKDL